jgi:hypothetical protein
LLYSIRQGEGLKNLVRLSSGAVYYVENGNKHVFPDGHTLSTLGPTLTGDPTLSYTNLSSDFVNTLTEGAPELIDGSAIKATNSAAIYLYDNGKRSLFSADAWVAWGRPLTYSNLSGTDLNLVTPSGKSVSQLITDGTNKYLVDSGTKRSVDSTTETAWGLSDSDFVQYTTASESKLGSGPALGKLLRDPSGTVYLLHNHQKWPIASGTDFTGLGLSWGNVQTLQSSSVNLVPSSGSTAFGPNSLIRLPSTAIVWIDSNFVKHTIPSLDAFNNFGFKWTNVRKYPAASVGGYTEVALHQLVVSSANSYYLIDLGGKHSVSSGLYSSSGYNFAATPSTPLSDKLLGAITNTKALTAFVQGSSATVYMVENGQKHPLSSPSALTSHGGSWSTITHVSASFLSTIPTGSTYN